MEEENLDVSALEFPAYIMDCIRDLDSQVNELYDKMADMTEQLDNIQDMLARIREE